MDKDPFKEYIKQSEPNKRDKGYAWHTAIGLQAVDVVLFFVWQFKEKVHLLKESLSKKMSSFKY